MTVHRFTVPGNPVPKARARVKVSGRTYTPARTMAYEAKVRLCARHLPCLEGPVRVSAVFFREDATACDLDNLLKSVLDGMNGQAFEDDRQIVMLSGTKTIDRENPRAEVEVEDVEAM